MTVTATETLGATAAIAANCVFAVANATLLFGALTVTDLANGKSEVTPAAVNITCTNTGIFIDGVAFGGSGSFVSGAVITANGLARKAVRTDTFWRQDQTGRMETPVVGDAVGSDGAWSRPARYSGIRFARDFSLTPGYVTDLMPTLSGPAALPSTVDIIVNNLSVGAGPFDLTQVPPPTAWHWSRACCLTRKTSSPSTLLRCLLTLTSR